MLNSHLENDLSLSVIEIVMVSNFKMGEDTLIFEDGLLRICQAMCHTCFYYVALCQLMNWTFKAQAEKMLFSYEVNKIFIVLKQVQWNFCVMTYFNFYVPKEIVNMLKAWTNNSDENITSVVIETDFWTHVLEFGQKILKEFLSFWLFSDHSRSH